MLPLRLIPSRAFAIVYGAVVTSATDVAQGVASFDSARDKAVETIMSTKTALDRNIKWVGI